MEQQAKQRIEFIDLTKGLCIMLVVMMHVGGVFDSLATGPVLSSFTMPLYFFVSGLFFKSYEGFAGFLARKADKLLVPFLIFYLGAFLLMYGISKAVPGTFRLPVRWSELLLVFRGHELIRFNPPIWFLIALFNCNILFYLVHYLRRKHIPTMFAVTLLVGATGFWLGKQRIELPFYIDVAMTALPFYFAGFWIRRYNFFLFPHHRFDKLIPLFILLGVLCGLMAWYFTSMNSRVGGFFKSIDKQYKKWLWGGAILGILIFVFPPLYGEGYEGFTSLMHGNAQELFNNSLFYRFRDIDWVIILFVIATMFFKVIAMSTTNAAGGVGGTFAPSLFVGAFTGASLALVCNTLFGWEVSIVSFTLVGMAGVMSGVMNAPLTSIFLIAELSNGYGLFIPLMITACISFAVDYYLDPDSIYTKQLRQKGELLTHDKDQSVFVFLKLEELMETDFLRIKENMTLGDIVHIISTARRNIFPVIDNFGRLIGVVQLDDLREDMFKHEKYGHPISDYMIPPPDKIIEHEAILSVMEKFEDKHAWMLPVVDKQGRYLGFISKSRILNAYREQLVKIQQ